MKHETDWNAVSDTYNRFAFSELEDSRRYLEAIGVRPDDTVLDVCCGPGRLSVLAAQMGAYATGIDSAESMLKHARVNALEAGVAERCEFRLLDWECVLPHQNLKQHDVVIASRCSAMMDVGKLSALAHRTVAVQIFADAPSLPELWGVLFSGCAALHEEDDDGRPPFATARPMPGSGGPGAGMGGFGGSGMGGPGASGLGRPGGGPGLGGPGRPSGPDRSGLRRERSVYLDIAKKAYAAGFDPNIRIFPERFRRVFPTEGEAVEWVCALKPELAEGNESRVAVNVAPFLHSVDDGVEFCISTAAAIIWWDVRGPAKWIDWSLD